MTIETADLVIVGAGPAGMACALDAARAGLDVLVLDENPMPGGQIYRNVGRSPLPDAALLGDDYTRGGDLVSRFAQSGVRYWPETLVWQVTRCAGDQLHTPQRHRGERTDPGESRGDRQRRLRTAVSGSGLDTTWGHGGWRCADTIQVVRAATRGAGRARR